MEDEVLGYLQGQADQAQKMVTAYKSNLADAKTEGIEIGRGQFQEPDPAQEGAVFTQEQLSAAVKDAEALITAKFEADVAKKDADLAASAEALDQANGQKVEALKSLKKEIAAKIKDTQVDDLKLAAELEAEEEVPAEEPVKEEAPVEGQA